MSIVDLWSFYNAIRCKLFAQFIVYVCYCSSSVSQIYSILSNIGFVQCRFHIEMLVLYVHLYTSTHTHTHIHIGSFCVCLCFYIERICVLSFVRLHAYMCICIFIISHSMNPIKILSFPLSYNGSFFSLSLSWKREKWMFPLNELVEYKHFHFLHCIWILLQLWTFEHGKKLSAAGLSTCALLLKFLIL